MSVTLLTSFMQARIIALNKETSVLLEQNFQGSTDGPATHCTSRNLHFALLGAKGDFISLFQL